MNDVTLLNELEQKIVGLLNALKAEKEKKAKEKAAQLSSTTAS